MSGSGASGQDVISARRRRLQAQNYLVIWIDENIDLKQKDFRYTLKHLRHAVNEVQICTERTQCIQALNELDQEKAFVISSGVLGPQLVPDIHPMAQVHALYIFCGNKTRNEQWAAEWPKIRGIFISIKPLCASLKEVARECDHNDIPMSFVPKQATIAAGSSNNQNLDHLPSSYMYSVIFKEIILEINDDEKQMTRLVSYCDTLGVPEKELKYLETQYDQKSPVWWYTRESFLYGMLNKALRSLDMEGMTKMGFFIRHLHQQLEQMHQKQSISFTAKFIVYRGQGLTQNDFQNLYDIKGGLLSFNNFLSTSKQREIAMGFARHTMEKNKDYIGVLFVIIADPKNISTSETPFAFIDEESASEDKDKEKEILFTMHTVFRVKNIKKTSENERLYEVELTMTSENDPDMNALTQQLKKEFSGKGWYRMGKLMLKVGHLVQAEELYNRLLEEDNSDASRVSIYHHLGYLKGEQGEYLKAAKFYEESLKIQLKTVPKDDISLVPTYGNIAGVYLNMNDYSNALEFYEKSLKIEEKALPSNHPDLTYSYNSIGSVHKNMGNYSKALEFYGKSMKINEKSLPPNHPNMATSYNNIGLVYYNMGNYSKALELYEKSHKIKEKVLPPDHPDLANSYNNIGLAYSGKGDHAIALKYLEKALSLWQKSLPSRHPLIETAKTNIAAVREKM